MKLNNLSCILLICHISLILISCKDRIISNDAILLYEAEELVRINPNKTLSLLDSISNLQAFSDIQKNSYAVVRIQAKDQLNQDISHDTIIVNAATYFFQINDLQHYITSEYYCGRMYHEQGHLTKAMNSYAKALEGVNTHLNDKQLKSKILANMGYLLFEDFEYQEALKYFKEASELLATNEQTLAGSISMKIEMGNCFLMLEKTDSAFLYYDKSIKLAKGSTNPELLHLGLQNLGSAYLSQNKYKEAIETYRQILTIKLDSVEHVRTLLNIASAYNDMNIGDSAVVYLRQAQMIGESYNDPYILSNMHYISSEINELLGSYQESLQDYKKYTEDISNIFSEKESKSILDIQKKYQFEQVKNKHNELKIEYQQIILVCLGLFLIVIALIFTLSYHIQQKKKAAIELENKMLQLDNLALNYDKKHSTFKDTLLHHFDILKKAALMQIHLREDELKRGEKLLSKFNEIVYNQNELDWDMLYNTMNVTHDGFIDLLQQITPTLDEEEFKICSMIYSDFSNAQMSLILKCSSSHITFKRSSIREKIGLEKFGNISAHLQKLLNQYNKTTKNRRSDQF